MAVVEEVRESPPEAEVRPESDTITGGEEKGRSAAERVENTVSEVLEEVKKDDADIPPQIHFEAKRFIEARDGWSRQVRSCNYVINKGQEADDEDDKPREPLKNLDEYLTLRRKARLNLSLVSLKLRDYGKAVEYAEEVLHEDPTNEKALYRRAVGLFEQGKILDASKALNPLANSSDSAVVRLRTSVERQVARKAEIERRMMAGVLEENKAAAAGWKHGLISWVRDRSVLDWFALAVGCGSVLIGGLAVWGRKEASMREKL
eukprot:Blabericola_migrator_1__1322@NODE_1343_length_4758_cov_149_423151_g901_i0_p2_GENE_NODE_1343_length_4758_cov_149_423151_g901_i0NODE_1343_length_4758_cov_149_423151_g901_i0_p2_ORF_typecomplete_len262_score49_05TPR_19/PF14559_6/1_2e06ANAPC3/PF12895_7/1_9e06TPR_18/PF13512_6/4_7e06TPR_16/PF13432_6/6_9e05Fis1_TPR_C/PF14853_6/0_0033Fis1_TPR_C/PF14853_6/61TPR_15/PF13429_6/0_001TPR_6/PF13174_6/7_5e03TPR_6/PF13174_6/0_24TPR_6/PF13174_6/25BTAD/PF03704_17/0_00077TPR_21/PF09976_9/0_0019TPR_21/PF09976_9/2_5e0